MVINKKKKKKISVSNQNVNIIKKLLVIKNRFQNCLIMFLLMTRDMPNSERHPSEYINNIVLESMYIEAVTEGDVVDIFKHFKNSSACWDEFSHELVKSIKDYNKIPLTHICNLSLTMAYFLLSLNLFLRADLIWCSQIIDQYLFNQFFLHYLRN